MKWIIASHAIWALGDTEQKAVDDYVKETGDDLVLRAADFNRNPSRGDVCLLPCSDALALLVDKVGGDVCWDIRNGTAVLPEEDRT